MAPMFAIGNRVRPAARTGSAAIIRQLPGMLEKMLDGIRLLAASMSAWGHELPRRRKFAASALPPKAAAAVADRRGSQGPGADVPSPDHQAVRSRYRLSTVECFNAQDGREMPRNLVPVLALVGTGKD
jgi:hypothetical protein